MITSNKISSFVAGAVICTLLLKAGCVHPTEETAKTKVAPEETIKTKAEPEEQKPTVQLALKFTPQDSTTYKVTTEAQKSVKWEGSLPSKAAGLTGGHTGRRIEMTLIQRIQSVDDKGNAIAEITIKELKYLAKEKDYITLDFDSSREKDQDSPLARLIGQSYIIEITPAGQVSNVIDVSQAQSAVKGISQAHKTALTLLSANVIKERHTISALPLSDKNELRKGEDWSSTKFYNFGMMGSKSYERIYTLKEIEETDNRRIAVVEMNAVPSTERAKELYKEQATGVFSKLFDNTETYTGQLKLDLAAGKVEEYFEKLQSEWVIVLTPAGQGDDKEPIVSIMAATHLYSIEKLD